MVHKDNVFFVILLAKFQLLFTYNPPSGRFDPNLWEWFYVLRLLNLQNNTHFAHPSGSIRMIVSLYVVVPRCFFLLSSGEFGTPVVIFSLSIFFPFFLLLVLCVYVYYLFFLLSTVMPSHREESWACDDNNTPAQRQNRPVRRSSGHGMDFESSRDLSSWLVSVW